MPTDASATIPVVAPRGDLDVSTARGLGSHLAEIAGSPGNAVLDLSDVGFVDSMGLGVVVKAVTRFSRQDKALLLVIPPESPVLRLLEFSGMQGRLAVFDTRDEALERAGALRERRAA